jgi:hypothetical protein
MAETTKYAMRTADELAEFRCLYLMAEKFREIMDNLVEEIADFTGESGDADGMSNTVAWDVVYNGDDLDSVLRRCKLTLASPTPETETP